MVIIYQKNNVFNVDINVSNVISLVIAFNVIRILIITYYLMVKIVANVIFNTAPNAFNFILKMT